MFGLDLPIWLLTSLGVGRKIVSGVFTFLATKPGVYVLAFGVAIGSLWYSYHLGCVRTRAADLAQQQLSDAKAEADALARGMVAQGIIDAGMAAAAENAGFLRGLAQSKTITITKEIPHYVTVETDRLFPLPCGLVRLHDAAALAADPATLDNPSALTDGEACPIKASDLAGVIVGNYGLDHEKDAQIIGLQQLVQTLSDALTKPISK